jgi:hypothetical protein
MLDVLLEKDNNLSKAEIRGLGRIVLAVRSANPSDKSTSHKDKLMELSGLFPYLNAVQVGYDSVGSRTDTSPLSLFCKVKALKPKHNTIIDTRFARDSWEGMLKDLIDYDKEVKHKEDLINRNAIESRKQRLGGSAFKLPAPDEITIDVDVKTSHELLRETDKWLFKSKSARGSSLTAIVGTSRKPLQQYNVDVDSYALDMVQTILDAGIACKRIVAGVCSARAIAPFCIDNNLEPSFTGAYIPEYDLNGIYKHQAALDLRDVADINGSFVIGSPVFGNRGSRDVLLHHAQILGEK